MSERKIVCAKCGGPLDAVTAEMAHEVVTSSPDITMPWCYGCAHPARLPTDMLSPCCGATRRESTDIFVRFLIRQGLGPLGKLTGREFAAHVAGGILATEPTSVSVDEVAVLDGRAQPFTVAAASDGVEMGLGEKIASAAAALLAANPPPDSGLWEPEVSAEERDGKTVIGLFWKAKRGVSP